MHAGAASDTPLTSESLAQSQGLPAKFLESILNDMRRAGLLTSQRGPDGGYRLARPAERDHRGRRDPSPRRSAGRDPGLRPEAAEYVGAAEHLQAVWVAVRASLRSVLEEVSIADIVSGELPETVARLTTEPGAWELLRAARRPTTGRGQPPAWARRRSTG